MADNTHLGTAAAAPATDGDATSPDLPARGRVLSDGELDAVTGGLNPQPLPPRVAHWGMAPTMMQLGALASGW